MHFRNWLGGAVALALCLRATAVGIDDTYQQVITEKGTPSGKMQAGDMMILRYADETIRLKAGKVVAIEAKNGVAPTATPETAPPSTPKPASAKPVATADAAVKEGWTTNYRTALADAKALDRRIFLFFTGSDWCGWCKKLNREILSTPEFKKYAEEKLILVEIDFPHDKPQSAEVQKQNATLQRAFEISGYPTVVVLNAAGREVGRLRYQEGGPKPFLKQLKSL